MRKSGRSAGRRFPAKLAGLALLTAMWLVCGLCSGGLSQALAAPGVGFRYVTFPGPLAEQWLEGVVFYPSSSPTTPTPVGNALVDAQGQAAPEPGRHPLAVLSHGSAGSMLGHHDLAEALARAGYVVAALNHPGDNYKDHSAAGTPSFFTERPRHVSALIDAVLNDPGFKELVDPSCIVAAGYSMGGYTVLLLAGARPDFSLLDGYCEKPGALGFCANRNILRQIGSGQQGPDPRIKAVAALAPLDAVFAASGLASLSCPVYLAGAENDRLGLSQENASAFSRALPSGSRLRMIPEAGHFVFLSPCSQAQATARPQLCADPEGVDRQTVHESLNRDIIGFFNTALGSR